MNSRERLDMALLHCEKIRNELLFSYGWISTEPINEQWVRNLDSDEMKKERVSAFCARFGKFQDYFSDKVLRLWLEVVGEHVGTALENFSVAERTGILTIPSEQMVELRTIRNRLTGFPSVFRLPRVDIHATSFCFCCALSQSLRNCIGDLQLGESLIKS